MSTPHEANNGVHESTRGGLSSHMLPAAVNSQLAMKYHSSNLSNSWRESPPFLKVIVPDWIHTHNNDAPKTLKWLAVNITLEQNHNFHISFIREKEIGTVTQRSYKTL